jgi:ABC-type spermidine/putrescine transport system permease subunit II
MSAAKNGADRVAMYFSALLLIVLYAFLYAPIAYIAFVSVSANTAWPFPVNFSLEGFRLLLGGRAYQEALWNSLIIGFGTALISTVLATLGAIAVLKYDSRFRYLVAFVMITPLFTAELLVGISSLVFNRQILGLSGNIPSAILANSVHAIAFAFLVLLAQLLRYNWRLDDAAMVFGARPVRCFWEVTLPNIWPAILGAFIIAFIMGFNNLEISFYNLGASQTISTAAWGSLRHGMRPELPALATLVNIVVLITFFVMFFLMHYRIASFGHREE